MTVTTHELPSSEGHVTTDFVTPEGAGPFRVVILCVDGGGRRPAMNEIAERIATLGYLVVIPDLFHRTGSPWNLLPPGPPAFERIVQIFGDADLRTRFMRDYLGVATSPESLRPAFEAVFAALDARADVQKGKVGLTGYCMGGSVTLRVAAMFPDRVGAAASIHGGFLVSDAPNSPHLGAAAITGEVYVAGATDDPSFTDAAKATLVAALEAAGVTHRVETYAGTRHGFAVPDHAGSFDPAAAERHYAALEHLFERRVR